MIETQIALLSAHIYKYPLQTVEKYLESVSKLEKEISELTAKKLQQEQGAQFWAYVGQQPGSEMSDYLFSLAKPQIFPLKHTGASLFLFNLEEH